MMLILRLWQVGIVKEDCAADTLFLMFLDQIENNGNHLTVASELSESAASLLKLNEEMVFIRKLLPLTVASTESPQSILQSILSGYETGKSTIRNIVRTHPSGLWDGIQQMLNQQETLTEVSLGGQTINGSAQFFYALIAMTCLYGYVPTDLASHNSSSQSQHLPQWTLQSPNA